MFHPSTLHDLAASHITEMRDEATHARLAHEARPADDERREHVARLVAVSLLLVVLLAISLG